LLVNKSLMKGKATQTFMSFFWNTYAIPACLAYMAKVIMPHIPSLTFEPNVYKKCTCPNEILNSIKTIQHDSSNVGKHG
jgi:hypothetical protein